MRQYPYLPFIYHHHILDSDSTPSLHVNAGLDGEDHTIAEDDENTESEAVESPGDTATHSTEYVSETEAVARMEGLITIVLARYLHLNVEMLYKKEPRSEIVDMFDTSFLEERRNKDSVFYLKQNRRMRSKETHYIDHPKFSMLVRITPFEVAPKVVPETTTRPH